MPWTALFFLVGAVAISGLPLLNGFVSEWLTFQALLHGFAATPGLVRLIFPLGGALLALTSALAAACFVQGVRHQLPGAAAGRGGGRGARVAAADARAAGVPGGVVRRAGAVSRRRRSRALGGVTRVAARAASGGRSWCERRWRRGSRRVRIVRSRRAAVVLGAALLGGLALPRWRCRLARGLRRCGACRRGDAAAS